MSKVYDSLPICLTLAMIGAGSIGCAATDDSTVALAEVVPTTALTSSSATDILDWYDQLDTDDQAAALDILLAHSESAPGLADATLYELRANHTALIEDLKAVLEPEDVVSFPAPETLGVAIYQPIPDRQPHVIDDEPTGVYGYTTSGTPWTYDALTYCIDNYVDGVSNDRERNQVERAGEMWGAHSPLTFTKVSSCSSADIKIKYKSKGHGEDNCGDFSSNSVLAHAKYPVSSGSQVYLHMNKGKDWDNVGSMSGWDKFWNPNTYDLRTVFAHEFGHNIGIAHSSSGGAVMHSTISALETKWSLHSDDISAVQALYGSSLADTAYARSSYAQALTGRAVLILRETTPATPEARAALEELASSVAVTDEAVLAARRAAVAERDDDAAAAVEHTLEVTDELDQAWLRLDDARGHGVDLAQSLTAEAFSTISVATSDLNLR